MFFFGDAEVLLIPEVVFLFHAVLLGYFETPSVQLLAEVEALPEFLYLVVGFIEPSFVVLGGQDVVHDLFFERTVVGLEVANGNGEQLKLGFEGGELLHDFVLFLFSLFGRAVDVRSAILFHFLSNFC